MTGEENESGGVYVFVILLVLLAAFAAGACAGHSLGRFSEKHDAVLAGAAEYYVDTEGANMTFGGKIEKKFRYLPAHPPLEAQ